MKNVVLILSFSLVACVVNAQATWDYPVKPGSEEWRVTSYDEKVEKSQPQKFREKTENERLVDEGMDAAIIKKVHEYLNDQP